MKNLKMLAATIGLLSSMSCAKNNFAAADAPSTTAVGPDLMYCFKPAPKDLQTTFYSNTSDDLQAFGDSLAMGFTSCDPSAFDHISTGFVVPLAQALNMPLDNRAIGGTESGNQLLQIQIYGQRHTAVKILMSGYNDAYFATDMNTYKSNLTQSIQIMAANADLVVIGTTPKTYAGDVREATIDNYAQAVRDVVASLNLPNVKLLDVNQLFAYDPSNFNPDHVHFNTQGSAILSNLFKTAIDSAQ